MVPPAYHAEMSVVRLDGSDGKSVGPGLAPSLSPDGTRMVYVGGTAKGPGDGLYITELASGNTTRLPGTTTGDWGPLWSPDGQKIAFTRGSSSGEIGALNPSNIIVTNLDGSNFHQLTKGEAANLARAWMPDGDHLLYTDGLDDGAALHLIDVQTGEVTPLSGTNSLSAAISLDGKRLAFHEMLPGDQVGLFVANLDGSDRKLLSDGDPYIVTSPIWSPDGNWIIASVIDPNTSQLSNPALALIRVDDCQIIPLPGLSGYASSWLP
jgi:TolB protein